MKAFAITLLALLVAGCYTRPSTAPDTCDDPQFPCRGRVSTRDSIVGISWPMACPYKVCIEGWTCGRRHTD